MCVRGDCRYNFIDDGVSSPIENCVLRVAHQHEYTLEEIGARFGVTRERIRQIEAKALRKMARGFGVEVQDIKTALRDLANRQQPWLF